MSEERGLEKGERMVTSLRGASCPSITALLVFPTLVGCAFQQKQVEEELADPARINCATAQGDIRMLQQEKANVAERVAEGVTAVYPASFVIGMATGVEETKAQVAIGEYNSKIDTRIAEIKQTCGLP